MSIRKVMRKKELLKTVVTKFLYQPQSLRSNKCQGSFENSYDCLSTSFVKIGYNSFVSPCDNFRFLACSAMTDTSGSISELPKHNSQPLTFGEIHVGLFSSLKRPTPRGEYHNDYEARNWMVIRQNTQHEYRELKLLRVRSLI